MATPQATKLVNESFSTESFSRNFPLFRFSSQPSHKAEKSHKAPLIFHLLADILGASLKTFYAFFFYGVGKKIRAM